MGQVGTGVNNQGEQFCSVVEDSVQSMNRCPLGKPHVLVQ